MLKYSVKFSIKKNEEDKPVPVRIRVSFNSLRPELYSGILVKPSEWDSVFSKIAIKNDKRNTKLSKYQNTLEEIFGEFEVIHKRYPTTNEIINEWNRRVNFSSKNIKSDNPLLLECFDQFIEHNSTTKQWSPGTVKSYVSIKNHWESHNPERRINDLTEKDLINFIKYFQTAPIDFKTKNKKLPHRNTTVEKNMADFRFVLKWLHKQKIYKGDLYESFEYIFKGTAGDLKEIVYLEWDELIALFEKDFGTDRLNHVRDVFCFCCFTGLRFSDVKKLQHSDIRNGYFMVTTEKTLDPLRIDLHDYSFEILSRYKDFPQPLPIVSHDKTNAYLKDIGELMEWNDPVSEVYFVGEKRKTLTSLKKEVISTHAGRRTFVVNALKMKIPSIVIRSWTGHKDERAMKPYIKIVDELKSSEMQKFNRKATPENPPENNETE